MEEHNKENSSYKPLVIIIGLILLIVIVLALKDSAVGLVTLEKSMSQFMAGFFLVFSGFKLLDIKGFAQGYSMYDLLAKKVFVYGYVYPFIELFLGLGYLLGINSTTFHLFTFLIMTFSGAGVLRKLLRKEKFQCACLGTFLKVPLTKITLVEDFGMAAMAIMLLV